MIYFALQFVVFGTVGSWFYLGFDCVTLCLNWLVCCLSVIGIVFCVFACLVRLILCLSLVRVVDVCLL